MSAIGTFETYPHVGYSVAVRGKAEVGRMGRNRRVMFQRLAISNGYGWQRFLHMVDQVMPRRGDTLQLPLEIMGEAAN